MVFAANIPGSTNICKAGSLPSLGHLQETVMTLTGHLTKGLVK